MFFIPQNEQGEAVVSLLVISAGVVKWISDQAKKKVEKEEEVLSAKEEEIEVITRKDLNIILSKLNETNDVLLGRARNAFEDTLACINIINILLQVISLSDKRKTLLKTAEQHIYLFFRSADFPSRQMILTMIELAIKDVEEITKEMAERKEKKIYGSSTPANDGHDKPSN